MAKATIKMPEEFLLKVSRLGAKTDEILPRVLEAGAEIVEDKVRSNLTAVIGKDLKEKSRSTGQLLSALGTSVALQDRNGDFNVKIRALRKPHRWGKAMQCLQIFSNTASMVSLQSLF